MFAFRSALIASATCAALVFAPLVLALDPPAGRVEGKRTDLTGAPGMEVITSVTTFKPGESIAVHFHHGVEATYIIQGSMIQLPGKDPMMLETGTQGLNLRDVLHGGYTVVGPLPLKIFAVHIVDKDKPLYDTK
jgi:hypothetical protein